MKSPCFELPNILQTNSGTFVFQIVLELGTMREYEKSMLLLSIGRDIVFFLSSSSNVQVNNNRIMPLDF